MSEMTHNEKRGKLMSNKYLAGFLREQVNRGNEKAKPALARLAEETVLLETELYLDDATMLPRQTEDKAK